MFSLPTETAPRLLVLFFLLLALIVTLIATGIYWEVIAETFVGPIRRLIGRLKS